MPNAACRTASPVSSVLGLAVRNVWSFNYVVFFFVTLPMDPLSWILAIHNKPDKDNELFLPYEYVNPFYVSVRIRLYE